MMRILRFILIVLTSVNYIKGQQSCSNIAQYFSTGYQTYGQVEISNVPVQKSTSIDVHLSVAAKLTSNKEWKLSLINQNAYDDIINGRSLMLKFVPLISNPLPTVTGVFLNNRRLCLNSPARGSYVTTIKLSYTHTINNIPQNIQINSYRPTTQNPYFIYQNRQTTQDPYLYYQTQPTHPPTPQVAQWPIATKIEDRNSQSYDCGVRKSGTGSVSFIVNGQKAQKHEFPWLAAFHYNKIGFICGGSIVSTRIIITAAHCIQDKHEVERRDSYYSTFYLGKYRLKDLNEEDNVKASVDSFVIHPHWNVNDDRYEGDVAIAILSKTIIFNDKIIPLCIWPQTTDHNDLIGQKGLIAGWGLTETKSTSDVPMFVSLPVVDDATCLRSNSIFWRITTSTTFCVGDGSGRSPCSGDSGGAFAVRNPLDNKYYFRGIVSAGLKGEELSCDNNNYVLFNDAAQHTDWINSYVNTYG